MIHISCTTKEAVSTCAQRMELLVCAMLAFTAAVLLQWLLQLLFSDWSANFTCSSSSSSKAKDILLFWRRFFLFSAFFFLRSALFLAVSLASSSAACAEKKRRIFAPKACQSSCDIPSRHVCEVDCQSATNNDENRTKLPCLRAGRLPLQPGNLHV